jgi:outer membrane murein-binding lipoprotein Lpp
MLIHSLVLQPAMAEKDEEIERLSEQTRQLSAAKDALAEEIGLMRAEVCASRSITQGGRYGGSFDYSR